MPALLTADWHDLTGAQPAPLPPGIDLGLRAPAGTVCAALPAARGAAPGSRGPAPLGDSHKGDARAVAAVPGPQFHRETSTRPLPQLSACRGRVPPAPRPGANPDFAAAVAQGSGRGHP